VSKVLGGLIQPLAGRLLHLHVGGLSDSGYKSGDSVTILPTETYRALVDFVRKVDDASEKMHGESTWADLWVAFVEECGCAAEELRALLREVDTGEWT
jgi:hypothetical protein